MCDEELSESEKQVLNYMEGVQDSLKKKIAIVQTELTLDSVVRDGPVDDVKLDLLKKLNTQLVVANFIYGCMQDGYPDDFSTLEKDDNGI